MSRPENTRDKLERIVSWLRHTHESISYGLRSIADAEKLYDYSQTRAADEYPDEWPTAELIRVLGYNPWHGA